jgi:hypothetical protein
MAFKHGKGTVVIKDGFNFSPYLQDVDIATTISEHESTCLADTIAKRFIPGLEEATLSANGLYDGDVGKVNDIIQAAKMNTSNVWTVFGGGDELGAKGTAINGIFTSYGVQVSFSDLVKMTVAGRANTPAYEITSLLPLSTKTITTTTTGVDNAVSTANGALVFLQIENVTGNITYAIQDSADNISFAQIATGTLATDLVSVISTIAGTIRRYVRVVLTLDGGESITAQISIARL